MYLPFSLLGLPWESPNHKMQALLGRQKGIMVPGVPCVETGDENATLLATLQVLGLTIVNAASEISE